MGWDRYPPYAERLRRAQRVAWIFPGETVELLPAGRAEAARLEGFLRSQLAAAGAAYRVLPAAGYRVYVGSGGRRPLPPPLPLAPVPLARPRAELLAADVPARAAPGAEIAVRVEVVNTSDAFWSAAGLPLESGRLRVSAGWRWLSAGGQTLAADGERALLPQDVPPGGTLAMVLPVRAPAVPGAYLLRLTFVQEGVAWFDQAGGARSDHPVEVAAGPPS